MYKIRCDKSAEALIGRFIEAAGLDCEITQAGSYDVCVLQSADIRLMKKLSARCIVIANADDFSLLRTLEGVGNTIITCGLSGMSTITLSSIEEEACVMCLQREIKSLSGKSVYPQEIPVRIEGVEPDGAILLFALGVLCDADLNKIKIIKLC